MKNQGSSRNAVVKPWIASFYNKYHQSGGKMYFKLLLLLIVVMAFIGLSVSLLFKSRINEGIAIVVLGGGLLPNGNIPFHTELRLERALQLYQQFNQQAKIITLSGGTTHKPNPVDNDGFPIWEASAAAKRLLEMKVHHNDVLEENFSLDTIGNVS
jgi:uncharacterized SAM-binding protein YcdF (DUF218 family)